MRVLGIETSCDETGLAIYDEKLGLLGQALYSQIDLHAEFGGVVPELASRDHVRKLLPLLKKVMEAAATSPEELDGVAYTAGPGLIGALLVGASVGRSLAWGWGIPAVAIHHMEAHLLAPMLEADPPAFPFVALLVSGGHTLLVDVQEVGQYKILGESVDDAAGEAFDKTAKMLGLPYPGGPALAALAERGTPGRFKLPRPMTDRPGLNFSFSGLKTAAITAWQDCDQSEQARCDIARAFQEAVVDTLCIKSERSLKQTGRERLVIAGGVSANLHLRHQLEERCARLGARVYYPRPAFCTDNGAMVAYTGYRRLKAGQHEPLIIRATPRWPMEDLSSA